MSFLMIPGVGLLLLFGVRLLIAGARPGRSPRKSDAVRRIDDDTLARLDRIAEEARRRDRR